MADQPLSSKEETTSSSQGNKQSEKRKPDPVLKAETNTNSYKHMKLKCKDPIETGNGPPPKDKKPKYKETSSTHVSEQKCHSHFSQTHSTRVKGDCNSIHSSASGENVNSVSGVGKADNFPPEQSFRPQSKTNLKYFDNVISKTDLTKKKSSDYFSSTDTSRPKSKPNLALLSCKDENDPGLKESLSSRKSEEISSNFKKPHKDSQKSLQNSYKRSSVKNTYYTSKTMKKNEIELFSSQTTGESVAEKNAEEVAKLKQEILEVLVKACDSRTSLKRFEKKYVQVKNSCKIIQEPEKAVNSNLPQSSSNNVQDIPKECMRDNIKNLTAHTMKTNDQKVKNTEVIRTHLQEEQEISTVMIEEGKKGEKEPSFKIPSKPVDLNFVKQANQNPDSKPLKAVSSEISLHKSFNDSKNLEGPTGKLEVINFSDHAIHLLKSEKLAVSETDPKQFDKNINLYLSNNSLKRALNLLYMKATSNKLRKSESIQSNLQCHSNKHSVGKGKHLIKLEGKSKSSDEEGSSKQSESEPSLKKGKKLQVTENTQHNKHSPKSSVRDPEWDVVVNEEMKEHNLENKPAVTRIASLPPELQITGDKKLKSGDNKMTDHKEKDDMKKVNLDDKALSRGSKFNDAAKGEQELPKQAEMKPSISEENKKVKVGLNAIKETGVNQKGVFGRIKVIDLRFKDEDNLSVKKKPEERKDEGSSEVPKKLNIALKPKPQIETSTQVSTERLPSTETKSTQTGIDGGPFTSTNNIPTLNAGTEASGKQVVSGMKEASTQTVKTKNKLNTALPSKEVVKKDTINLHEEHSKNLKTGVVRTKASGEADSHKRVVRKLQKTPDKKRASSNHVPPVIIKTYKPEGLKEVTQEFVKSDYVEPEIMEKETKSPLELLNAEVRRKRENTSAEYDKLPVNTKRKSKRSPKQSLAATASTKKSVKQSKEELKSSQAPEVIKKLAGNLKEPVIPTSTEYSLTEDEKSKIRRSTPVAPSKDLGSKTPDETQRKHMLEENVPKSIKTVHVRSQDTKPSEGDISRQTNASLAVNSNTLKEESKVSETPTVHRETKQQSLPEKINTYTGVNESSRITNKIKQSHLSEKAIIDSKISEPSKLAGEMKQTTSPEKPNVETKISVTPTHAREMKQSSLPEKPNVETKISVTPTHARETKQSSLPEKPNVETKISVTPTHARETKQSSLPEKPNVETKISVTPTHAREMKQSSFHDKRDIDTNISELSKHTREIKQSSLPEKPNTHAKILEPSKLSREEKQSILHEKPNIDTKMSESSRHATEIKQSTLAEKPKTDTKLSEPSTHAREIKQSTLPEKPKSDMKLSETSRHSKEIKQSALPEKPKIETKISEPARHTREIKQSTSSEKPNIDPNISESSRHTREMNQSTPPQKTDIVTKIPEPSRNSGEIKPLTSPEKPNIGTKISEVSKHVGEIKQLTSFEKPILDAKTSEPPKYTTEINRSHVSEKPYADSKVDKPPRHTDDIMHASLVDKPHTEEKLSINQSPVSEKPYTDSKMAEPLRPAKDTKQSPMPKISYTDPKKDESCRDAKQYTGTKIDESSKYSREQSLISEKPHTDPKRDEPSRQAREIKQPTLSEKPHTDPKRDEPSRQAREIKQPTLSEKPHTYPKRDEPPRQAREIKQPTLSEKPHTDPMRDEPLRQAREIKQPTLSEKPHTDLKRDEPPRQANKIKQTTSYEKLYIDPKQNEPAGDSKQVNQTTLSEKPHTDPKRDEPPRQAREIKQPTLSEKPHTDPMRDEPLRQAREIKQPTLSKKPHTDLKRDEPPRQANKIKQTTSYEKLYIDPKQNEPAGDSKQVNQTTLSEKPHTDPKRDEPPRQAREIKQPTLSEKPHTDPMRDEPLRQAREIKQPTLSEKPHSDLKRDEPPRQANKIKQTTSYEKLYIDPKQNEPAGDSKQVNQTTLSEKPHTDPKRDEPLRQAREIKQPTLPEKPHTDPKRVEPLRQAREIKQPTLSEKPHTDPKRDEPLRQVREIKQPTLSEKPHTDLKRDEKPHTDLKRDEPARQASEIKQTTSYEKPYIDPKQNEPTGDSRQVNQTTWSEKSHTDPKRDELLRQAREIKQPTLSEKPHTDPKRDEPPRYVKEVKQSTLTEKSHAGPKINEPPGQSKEIKQLILSEKSYTEPKMDESHRRTREIKQSTVPEKPYTDQKVSETPRLSIEIKQTSESETPKTDSKITETPILSRVTKQSSVSDKQTADLKVSETLRHKDAKQSPISEEPSTDSKMSETHRLFREIKPPPTTQKQNIDPKVPETLKVVGEIKESPVSRKTDTDKTSLSKYLEAERRKGGTDNNDMVTKGSVKEEYTKITSPKDEEKPKHKVTADQPKLQDESISKLEEKQYQSIATPKLQLKQQQSVKPIVIMTTPKDAKASMESTKCQKNIELVSSKGSEHRPHSERPSLKKNFIAETMKKAEEERGHQVFDTKILHEGALNVKNVYDTVKKSTAEERNAENAASPKSVVKQIEEKESISKKSVQEEAARYTVNVSPKSSQSKMQAQNQPEIKVCILPETQKNAVGKDPDKSVTQEQSTKISSVAKVTLQPDQKGPVSTHIKSGAKENIINANQTTESIVEKYEQVIKKQIPMFESEQRNTLEKSLGELAPAEPLIYFPSVIHGKDVLLKGERDEKDRWKTNDDIKKSEQNELNSKELNKKPSVKDTAAIKMKEEPLVETYFISKNFNRFFDSSHELSGSSSSKAFTSDSTKSESDGQQGSEKKQRSVLGLKTNVVSEVRYKIDKSKKKDISHTKYTKIISSESFKVGKQNRPTSAQGSQHPCIKTYLVSEFSRRTTKSSENFRLDEKPIDTEPLKTKDFRVLQGDKVDKVKDEKSHRTPEDYQNEKSNGQQIKVNYDTGDQSSQKKIYQVSVDSKSNENKKLDPGKFDSGEPQSSDSGHQTRDESNEDNDPQTDTQQNRKRTTDEQLEAAKELITKHLQMEQAMAPYLKHDPPKVVEYYKSKYMKDSVKSFLKAEGLERNTSKKEEKSMQGSSSEWKENVVTAKYPSKGLSQINKQYLHPENKVLSQSEESKPLKKVKSPKKDLSVVAKEYLRPSFISTGPLPPSPMPPSPYPPLPLPPLPPPSPTPPSPVPLPPLELESVSNEKDHVKPVSSDVTKTENLHNKSRTRIIQGISDAGMKLIQDQEFERDTKKYFEKSRVKLSKESFVPVDESNPTDTEGLQEPIKNLHLIENDIVTRTFKEIAPPLPKKEELFPLRITSSKSITDNVSLEERLKNRAVTSIIRDDNRLIPRPSTSAKLYPSSRYHEYRTADQRPNEQWDYDDPQLRGLSRHFNSSTIRGRANTAKATFLLVGLLSIYFLMKPEPPPPCAPVEGQPLLPPPQFQEPQLQQPYQLVPPLPPSEQQLGERRPSE